MMYRVMVWLEKKMIPLWDALVEWIWSVGSVEVKGEMAVETLSAQVEKTLELLNNPEGVSWEQIQSEADQTIRWLRANYERVRENEKAAVRRIEQLEYHDRHTDRQADACDICEGIVS